MTKSDDTRQLSPAAYLAVEALTAGSTVTEAANTAGLSRQHVSGLLHHHPDFRAELNRRRADSFRRSQDRLRVLAERALDTLEAQLGKSGQDAKTAIAVLKLAGLGDADLSKIGPTEARAYVDLRAATDRLNGRFTPSDGTALMEAMSRVELASDVTDEDRDRTYQSLVDEAERESKREDDP